MITIHSEVAKPREVMGSARTPGRQMSGGEIGQPKSEPMQDPYKIHKSLPCSHGISNVWTYFGYMCAPSIEYDLLHPYLLKQSSPFSTELPQSVPFLICIADGVSYPCLIKQSSPFSTELPQSTQFLSCIAKALSHPYL